MPYLLVFAGVFSVAGGAMDWDWFMNSRRAALFVKLLGRNGARVFYIILGVSIAGIGAAIATGAITR